jgi:protein-disulfide isomerase
VGALAAAAAFLFVNRGSLLGSGKPTSVLKYAEIPLPPTPISIEGAALEGDPQARLAVVMFSDFECPACRRFARLGLPDLRARFLATGKAFLAFRHFPQQFHPLAFNAAASAVCASDVGRFRQAHDALFAENQLSAEFLTDLRGTLNLAGPEAEKCEAAYGPTRVKRDLDEAKYLRVPGTPTFFVGVSENGRVRVLHRITGFKPSNPVVQFLEKLDRTLTPPH